MSVIRNLVVKITGDTGGLQQSLSGAQAAVKKATGAISGATGAAGDLGKMLGGAMFVGAVMSAARSITTFAGQCVELG